MAIIGEQFDNHGEYICGAAVNLRQKGDKVRLHFFQEHLVEMLNDLDCALDVRRNR